MDGYRILESGETIREGDEVDESSWRDFPVWKPANCIGEPAPCPKYPGHRVYRRKIEIEMESDPSDRCAEG